VLICVCQTPNQFEIEFNETTEEVTTFFAKGKIFLTGSIRKN
jgi:hypothetical protein